MDIYKIRFKAILSDHVKFSKKKDFFFEFGFPKIHLSQSSDGVEKKTRYLGSSTHRILSIPLLFMILRPIFPSPEAKIMLRENLVSAKRLTRFDKIALTVFES